jgi:hypothetical protein
MYAACTELYSIPVLVRDSYASDLIGTTSKGEVNAFFL